MPRINTDSLATQREWRRSQLMNAATEIALETGAYDISVAAVAARAGLSRTSVYEYFASSSEIVADLIIEELANFTEYLSGQIDGLADPYESIEIWITRSLEYVADGRHMLAKTLSAVDLPREHSSAIGIAHRKLLAPLSSHLTAAGITDTRQALGLIQSATDSATRRIEADCDAEKEITTTSQFCIAGIKAISDRVNATSL